MPKEMIARPLISTDWSTMFITNVLPSDSSLIGSRGKAAKVALSSSALDFLSLFLSAGLSMMPNAAAATPPTPEHVSAFIPDCAKPSSVMLSMARAALPVSRRIIRS